MRNINMYGEKPRQRKSLHYGTRPISNYKSREKISWKVVCTQLELGMVVIEMFTY